ncbi:cytochrome P450 6g1-like [Diprion similis]|uniref:cytochrome P450 6g1-like n=1 Tax=Diprion similis TaxID=362088 RepID=UPI001EF83925|nr:cytochrome P450 6g1-like [Diprion similis]
MEQLYCVVAAVIAVCYLLYYYSTSTFNYWQKKSIPCASGAVPGLGHMWPLTFMTRNPSDMYRDYYEQFPESSMIGFYNLRTPSLILRDPELIKNVLTTNFQSFAANAFDIDKNLDPLIAVNPFFTNEDRWKISRSQLSSAFTSGKLKYLYESVQGVCGDMSSYLKRLHDKSGGKVQLELKDLCSKYTADIVSTGAFGVEGGSFVSEKDGPFREVGRAMFEPSFWKGLKQIFVFFIPIAAQFLKLRVIPTKADKFFRGIVKDVLRQRETHGIERPDFLQIMIQARKLGKVDDTFKEEYNDDVITSHASSFFIDGYETSSTTMSFALYQLAAHPAIQQRLREEVNAVIEKHGGLTYEAVQDMSYMDMVLNESARLFPAFATMIKRCTKEIELTGSDGLTCQVTPGTGVVIITTGLHRDPRFWPNPDVFDPERFSEKNKKDRHKFVFLPFGEGYRICPGQRMATLQMKAGVATILQKYILDVSPRTKEPIELDPRYFMTFPTGGLWVNLTPI